MLMLAWTPWASAAEPVGESVSVTEARGDTRTAARGDTRAIGSPRPDPLDLETVLVSADVHFPMLIAVGLERDVRSAELRSSRGDFDTRLNVEGEARPVGFYESLGGEVGLEQPTRLWGARFFGGYRYGGGDFPSYDGDRLTDGSGEVSGGVRVPLLRGGPIDKARAGIDRRQIDLERVEPDVALERMQVRRDAARAYWQWVASGLALDVTERLLEVAVDRQSQIEGRVRRGAEAEIDLVDNERLIVDRQIRLRGTQRDFERATMTLSLYLRDEAGRPLAATRAHLPDGFPGEAALDREVVRADLERARKYHPLIRKLDLEIERFAVDERLAKNDTLPGVDFTLHGSRDFGSSEPGIDTTGKLSAAPRSETQVKALLRIELPIQQRAARGRLAVARLKAAQTEQRRRLERERIVVDVKRAVASLDAAYDQTVSARHNLALAERLRLAEERKLSLGTSNLIDVNIRELQAASAAQLLIEAQADYFFALADYEAASARPFAGMEVGSDTTSPS
jgi:outer membrane protein TolC